MVNLQSLKIFKNIYIYIINMRRIKSAPANIASMVNRKKEPKIPEISKININNYEILIINKNDNIIKSEIEPLRKSGNGSGPNGPNGPTGPNGPNLPIEYKFKKDVANNRKKITTTISGIISDSFIETNKHIPSTDTYVFNYIIEFINNFITNKFNRKNLENFILSLMIRFITSQVYHDVIIKVKENMHLIT